MLRVLRILLQAVGGIWSLLIILIAVSSLALSISMTLLPAVLSAVSSAVETVTGATTLRSKARLREAALVENLDRSERQIAASAADLNAEKAARRIEVSALESRIDNLTKHSLDAPVSYRGTKVALRDAVSDTSNRIARRTSHSATRTVASTFGEALPFLGVGVAVAATAWELNDSCLLIKEMRELDAAFNPDRPISEDEVCGMKPPTTEEVWAMIKSSPSAVWAGASDLYDGLPDISISASYTWAIDKFSSAYAMWGASDDPVGQAEPTPLSELSDLDPPSDLNPLNWFDGK